MRNNPADWASGGRCCAIFTQLLLTLFLAPALPANEVTLQPSAPYRELFPTPLPSTGPARHQERREAYRAFLAKPLQTQAQTWTYPTPELAAATTQLLDDWVDGLVQEAFGGRLRGLNQYLDTVEQQAKTLTLAGVTEPTVVLLSLPASRLKQADYERQLAIWLDPMQHPPGQRPAAMAQALKQLIARQQDHAPPETLKATVACLAKLLTSVLSQAGEQEEAAYIFAERQASPYASPVIATILLEAVTQQHAVREQASLHLLAAILHHTLAKAARDQVIGNVAQPDHAGYQAHLTQSETHLKRAMVLNPKDATAPAKMVHLTMLQGAGGLPVMRQWLVQALLLDMDCSEALFNMMWGLGENWYGQPGFYMDLYIEAALTRRFDSLLPALLLEQKMDNIVLGAIHEIKDDLDYPRLYPFCRQLLADIQAAPRPGMRPEFLIYATMLVDLAERNYPAVATQLANNPTLRKPAELLAKGTLAELLPPDSMGFAAMELFYTEPWLTRIQEWQAMAKTATPAAVDKQYLAMLKILRTESSIMYFGVSEALASKALSLIGLAKFSQGKPFVPAARLPRPGAMLLTEISNKTLSLPLQSSKSLLRLIELAPVVPAGFGLSAKFTLPQAVPLKGLKAGWNLVPITSGFWPFEQYQVFVVHGPETGIGIYRYCGLRLTVQQFTKLPQTPASSLFEIQIDAVGKLHTFLNGQAVGEPYQLTVPADTHWLTGVQLSGMAVGQKLEITEISMRRLAPGTP